MMEGRALFIPFAPSLAHVSRCLSVAEAWRERGHRAIFAVGPERIEMVQGAGFTSHTLPEVPGATFRTARGFRWLTPGYFATNLAAERRVLDEVEPDLVVFDFRFTTASSAQLAGLPSASILHGNGLRLALQPGGTARQLVGDRGDLRGLAALRVRFLQWVFPFAFRAFMRRATRRLSAALEAHRLPQVTSPFEFLLGDEILIADIAPLLPDDLPPNGHVVGPLFWSGWAGPAPWLEELDGRPLVYVTMGSTIEASAALVKILAALRDAPYGIVASAGSLSLPPDLQWPDHVRLFPTVPGATVAQRCSLIVHHGGHETLLQGLAAGVPSLILPANPDQILVAQEAVALGVGRSLWRPAIFPLGSQALEQITPEQIRSEIDSVLLDQGCARACEFLRQEIETHRGPAEAVAILEKTVRKRTGT